MTGGGGAKTESRKYGFHYLDDQPHYDKVDDRYAEYITTLEFLDDKQQEALFFGEVVRLYFGAA